MALFLSILMKLLTELSEIKIYQGNEACQMQKDGLFALEFFRPEIYFSLGT
jgi:hypothetical protein